MNERIVEAVVKAVLRKRSFVVWFSDIEEELHRLVTSEDEFERLRQELLSNINPISSRGKYDTCYLYHIYEDTSRKDDVIVVVPFCLGDEFEKPTLEELGKLYRDKGLHKALDSVINELIKVWAHDVGAPVDIDDAVSLLRRKLSSEDPQDKETNFVSNQQYMDSFVSELLRASARAYKQGLIALGIFMAALGAVLFTIGFMLGVPWLMVYSLPLLLIGIALSLVEITTNKNKDRGGR